MHIATELNIYDFRPVEGWHVYYFYSEKPEVYKQVMPGWLIMVENQYDTRNLEDRTDQPPIAERRRSVVAAAFDETAGFVHEADDWNLYMVQAPGQPEPTSEEIERDWKLWKALRP